MTTFSSARRSLSAVRQTALMRHWRAAQNLAIPQVNAPPARVFAALSDPKVLDVWWTLRSSGQPKVGETYEMFFGDSYDWRTTVTRCEPGKAFELTLTRFAHRGWPDANDHYRTSSSCWAMYLRLMKRHLETGEQVPYAIRLDV